jgi:hypothetical protein
MGVDPGTSNSRLTSQAPAGISAQALCQARCIDSGRWKTYTKANSAQEQVHMSPRRTLQRGPELAPSRRNRQRLHNTKGRLLSTPCMRAAGKALHNAAIPCPMPLPASRTAAPGAS